MINRTHASRTLAVLVASATLGASALSAGAAGAATLQPQTGPTSNVVIYTLTPTERYNVCGNSRSTTIKYIEPYGTYTVNCGNGDVDFQESR